MGIPHLAVNLRFWHKSRHRVHNHDVNRPGANHGFRNLQRLLPVVRLGNVEIVNIHADILRIHGIQRVLRVDKAGDASALLHLCNHVQRHRRLTAGFRAVHLDHSPLRHPAQPQRQIKAQSAGGNRLYIQIDPRIAKLHHRALSIRLLNLYQRSVQCFQLFILIHLILQIALRCKRTNVLS